MVLQSCAGTGQPQQRAGRRSEAVPVVVAKVTQRSVPVEVQVIGNVEAYATIGVKSQVGGELTRVHFQEGEYVKKGDLLFEIDRRPLEAQLNQAKANLARDIAQQSQAEANLARDIAQEKYAHSQAGRYVKLEKEGVTSREQTEQFGSDADAKAQAVSADRAAIESAKAAIAADHATVENAEVQLGYTTIRSPLDGRTGNLMIKQGNVVKATDIDLVSINQVQPIYVTFSVPESQLSDIKRYMDRGKLTVTAVPQNDTSDPQQGVLTFVDNNVDMTTGTIKLKGTFTNADRRLWPGEFVRVTLRLSTQADATLVPAQSVQTGQDGQFIYVVREDMTVEPRPVTAGTRIDQEQVIEKGVTPGETVVTEGQLRLAPGMKVQFRGAKDQKRALLH